MEQLAPYIRALLRNHDRAFIPGFGGFVKERVPARIDRTRNLFLPPTCTLSFNQRLGKEDGLLAERVMKAEGSDFESAKEKVRETAEKWQKSLAGSGRVELEGIGILFRDEEGMTHFEPDPEPELEPYAFGLSSFFVEPVRKIKPISGGREQYNKERRTPSGEEENENGEQKEAEIFPKKVSLKRIAAVVIPLLLVISLGVAQMKIIPEGAHFSEFLWTGHAGEAHYDPRKGTSLPEFALEFPEREKKKTPFRFRLEAGGSHSKVVRDNTEVSKNEKKPGEERAAYFVVGGCFEIKDNAEKRVQRLEGNGFPAKVLERKRKGLYVVAFDTYPKKRNALKGLAKARRTMPKAWLLHRP